MSLTERDAPANGHAALGPELFGAFASALREAGLQRVDCREATRQDVEATASSWAKRLGIPKTRRAWVLIGYRG